MIDRLTGEVRLALRGFRRSPTFVATAVLVLGLGIGMAVAMFTVFQAVLLRRLPVLEQERLVTLWPYHDPGVEFGMTLDQLEPLRRDSRTMRDVAAVVHWGAVSSPLVDGDRSLVLRRVLVSVNFFDVLGTKPALGRLFRPEDGQSGAPGVVVISYAAWRRHFGGDATVIGRRLVEPFFRGAYTIVGVAAPGLDYPTGAEVWMPPWPGNPGVIAVARLAPGASPAVARDEFFATISRLAPERQLAGATVEPFTRVVVGNVRPALAVLTAAVGLLLLIACVNVGNLLLLRAGGRANELAVRRALGASFADIVRQLVVESASLGVAGGALGLACAHGLLRAFVALAPPQFPQADVVRLAGAPVVVAVAATMLAVLFFGVAPALMVARGAAGQSLRFGTRSGSETRTRRKLRQLLVAAQVALALMMLAGAALLGRSLARLERLDLGYVPERLSIVNVALPATKYDSVPKLFALVEQIMPRWRAIPGVRSLTPILIPPFLGPNIWQWKFDAEGQDPRAAERNPLIPVEAGGPEYFRTFGIRLVRGRAFEESDRENAPLVVVVSESVARRFWPNEDPIGKRIRLPADPGRATRHNDWRTVVGVTDDIHFRDLREGTPTVYMPWRQAYWQGTFAVRTDAGLAAVLPAMRRELTAVDPELALWNPRTMDELLAAPLAQPRLSAFLLSVFGLTALLLAAIGLYGVMASAVREQTREMGIRLALGATPQRLRREVLGRALRVAVVGAVVGLTGALATARVLTSLLFQVSPADPVALLGASVLLLVVALIAAYVPALRATRINPAHALRAE